MELGADSWLWWRQERDGKPQELLGRSRSGVTLARGSFVQAVSILPLLGRLLFPEKSILPAPGASGDQICDIDTELVALGGSGKMVPGLRGWEMRCPEVL